MGLLKAPRKGATVSLEEKSIAVLGGWEGYRIGTAERLEADATRRRAEVWIELHPIPNVGMACSGCGTVADRVHDITPRWIRDLPLLGADTRLLVWRRRVACASCGPKLEALSWLDPYSRVTVRLANSVVRLAAVLPIKHVAEFFGLGWDAVKAIDKAALERQLGPPDLTNVQVIGIDEFSLHKRHRFATVVVDPLTKRVLWVGRGRTKEDLRPFFALLGPEGCQRLRAAVMDMNPVYEFEIRRHCPNAEIVFDLFHVVAKYGRDVIDRVRVDQANVLRKDKQARQVIKGSRWLLLRSRANLPRGDERVKLSELLAANKPLMTAYVLRDDLRHLWDFRASWAAQRAWADWYGRAMRSRIKPLVRFALKLKARVDGILAHCRWPLHTSLLEGINNRIKVMKRMAYGFRDHDYFFLKIRAAFPGIAG